MRTIFIDESGYSGSKFVDDDKPLFVVASLGIEPDEAERMRAEFFSSVNATELKHSKLVGRPNQRQMVLDFLTALSSKPEVAKVWLAEKRFAGWLKVIDHLTEPAMERFGVDAYRDGSNLAFASVLYKCLPAFMSPACTDEVLAALISALTRTTTEERDQVIALLKTRIQEHPHARDLLNSVALGPLMMLPPSYFDSMPPGASDMAFGAVLQLLGWWRSDSDEPFRVIHDATANVVRRKEVLDALVGSEIDPHVQRSASGMVVTFPIGATTVFEKSDGHTGLQLADVLAGALSCAFDVRRGGDRGKYAEQVLQRIEHLHLHALCPSDEPSPEAMGTKGLSMNTALDHLSKQFESGKVPMPRRHGKAKDRGD